MPSVQYLRRFFNERLAAAAEEIFNVVEKTIVEYEEEISRQRRLLTVMWKPQVKLHRTELPQKYVCKPEEVVTDEQPVSQERNSRLDHQDPEPPQIKEEQENLCISRDEEELILKQEPDICMQTLTNGKGDHSENETLFLNLNESQMATEEKSLLATLGDNSEISELNTNHQLLSHNSPFAGSQDRGEGKHGDSVSIGNGETKPQTRHFKTNNVHNPAMFKNDCSPLKGEKSFKCDTCGKAFPFNSKLIRHLRIHTGEKPYSCNVCGKRFNQQSILKVHKRIHTGERPHICNICGKSFNQSSTLKAHKIIHTGEKPYCCDTCGKRFTQKSILDYHFRSHRGKTDAFMVTLRYEKGDQNEDPTLYLNPEGSQMAVEEDSLDHISEIPELHPDYQSLEHRGGMLGGSISTGNGEMKPQKRHYKSNNVLNPTTLKIYYNTHAYKNSFKCETCGKTFPFQSKLNRHLRVHTGEKPYSCNICGKRFSQTAILKVHKRIHTGERPHSCNICGKSFNRTSILNVHKRIHTGERPFSCHICGKQFSQKSTLDVHVRTHTGEKPYSCKTCGKHLRSNSSLLVHMKTHTDEEPYSCETWEGFQM